MALLTRVAVLTLTTLVSAGALLAEEPAKTPDKTPEAKCGHCEWHWERDQAEGSGFAWQAQFDLPTKGLAESLDHRTGLGLGVQWNHDRGDGHLHRTRLEWNTFPEGNPVGVLGVQTKASNYLLSFDRLYHFSGKPQGAYILGGLGAVRWFVDQRSGTAPSESYHTTKLAITAGAGYRFNRAVALEARYLVSTVARTFDGNMLQASVTMRF